MAAIIEYSTGDNSSYPTYQVEPWPNLVQTFTLDENTTDIYGMSARVYKVGTMTDPQVRLLLRAFAGGVPGSIIKEFPNIDIADVTTDTSGAWVTVRGDRFDLVAGTYAMELSVGFSVYSDADNCIRWRCDTVGSTYPGGTSVRSTGIPQNWVEYPDEDFMFRINGYKFAPPEAGPTQKMLVAVTENALWHEDI